jgi:hypothetical protein
MRFKGWIAAAMVLSASGCGRVVTDEVTTNLISMHEQEMTIKDESPPAAGNSSKNSNATRAAWPAAFTQ